MDEKKLREVINTLDDEVPRDGAKIKLHQYGGGPDEGQIIANQAGYLRLGIEMMKGAFAPPAHGAASSPIHVDLEYLVANESTINFDWFERRELEDIEKVTRTNYIGIHMGTLFLAIFAALGVFAIIGVVTAIAWVTA